MTEIFGESGCKLEKKVRSEKRVRRGLGRAGNDVEVDCGWLD